MPWFVFDMHTTAGKIASGIFMRNRAEKYGDLSEPEFQHIWFHLSSAKIPMRLIKYVETKESDTLKADETAWWLRNVREEIVFDGKEPKEVVALWRQGMLQDIKGSVEWILAAREADKK